MIGKHRICSPNRWALSVLSIGLALLLAFVGCGEDASDPPEDPLTPTTGTLMGQVTPIDGADIQVRVLQNEQPLLSREASADGVYEIGDLAPGAYTVEFSAAGHEPHRLPVTILAGETIRLDAIALQPIPEPVGHLRGVLVDQTNKGGVGAVQVQLTDTQGNTWETLTMDTGVFQFENLPVDRDFTLAADVEGYEPQEVEIDPIEPSETVKLELALAPIPDKPQERPLGDGLAVGTEAPMFSLPNGMGELVSSDAFAGQKLVLHFDRGAW